MSKSCEWIPEIKGQQSKLFLDLMNITGDRSKAKELYSLVSNSEVQRILNLQMDELGEPTLQSIMENISSPRRFFGEKGYMRYIEKTEGLDRPFSTFEEAEEKFNSLKDRFSEYAFSILPSDMGYTVNMSDKSSGLQAMKKTMFNGRLQNRLLGILRNLGFDVRMGTTAGIAGRFSPMSARENAEGLRTVIEIAKGKKGEEVFPEEFAHVMIEGLSSHPLVIRLLDRLSSEGAVQEVLGEDYERYRHLYDNNTELLRKEAAGRLLADAIVKNEGIPLTERIYSQAKRQLSEGSTEEIDRAVREAEEYADSIADIIDTPESYAYFSREAVMRAPELYSLKKEVRELERIARASYERMLKRIKITAASSRERSESSQENKTLRKLRSLIDKKEYAEGCYSFLEYVLNDMTDTYDSIDEFNKSGNNSSYSISSLNKLFRLLRKVGTSITAYSTVVDDLASIRDISGISEALEEEDIVSIENKANEIKAVISRIRRIYNDSRAAGIFGLFRNFWGDDKIIKSYDGHSDYTLRDILEMAPHDVGGVQRFFSSMENASDALLALTDNMFKHALHIRDQKLFDIAQTIKAAHAKYVKASGTRDTSFMFERDEEGRLTGQMKSDIDYVRYYRERKEYIKSLRADKSLDDVTISARIDSWTMNHTEMHTFPNGRRERLPKKELYSSNALEEMTEAQKEYYNTMMRIKMDLDQLLPSKYIRTHRAPQRRASGRDAVMSNIRNPRQALAQIKGVVKNIFVQTSDDVEYGDKFEPQIDDETGEVIDGYKNRQILMDFAGNPVSKIPMPYLSRLEDMQSLSTDFTDSLLAYAGMVMNYSELSRIADSMEILKEFVADRKVQQTAGNRRLVERMKDEEGNIIEVPYTKEGKDSTIYAELNDYINRNMYSQRKKEEKVYLGNTELNYGKLFDLTKLYTTLTGMGYNIFSTASNVTMGNAQLVIEAAGARFNDKTFNYWNLMKGIKFYTSHMFGSMTDRFRDVKKNKLTILMQLFDPEENFFNETSNDNTARGTIARIMSILSPMQGMSAGEHYLHGVIMSSYLDHIKVRTGGKEISLLDAIEIVENTDNNGVTGYDVKLPEDMTFADGSEFTERSMYDIKRQIQVISHRINGAYSEVDKGKINYYALGRLVMNFRQWMPAYIETRYGKRKYNAVTDRMEEGFYRTAASFTLNTVKDLLQLKFTMATRWKSMDNMQKANLLKALAEMSMFSLLLGLLKWGGGEPDEDDSYVLNFLRYNGYRLSLELGSFAPTLAALENIQTLIRTPIPAMSATDRLISVFNFADIGRTVETGKYAGWNQYLKNLYYAVPYVRNVGRAVDLGQGDFDMFNVYLQK